MLADVPVRTGYVEAQAGVSSLTGGYVRGEVGARVAENLGLFMFGQATKHQRMAGAGLRYTFGW